MGSLNRTSSKCSMLIVDDDSFSRSALRRILERKYPALMLNEADNGRTGLDLFRELGPEIVLTDVAMPVMSGNRMAREIRGLAPRTQIIVITAHSDTELLLDCISIGVNRYLLKSNGRELLFEAVDDCLCRIELERKVKSRQGELTEEVLSHARRLIEKEEELRKRIAMELHDDIGQELTALGLNLSCIGNNIPEQTGGDLRERLAESVLLTRQIGRTVRNLMTDLRPVQLEEYGLAASVRAHAELYASRTGIAVEVRADHEFPRLAANHEIALFRVVQEALTNVLKHAEATRVAVHMHGNADTVRLSVADNGKGLSPRQPSPVDGGCGWGLANIRERIELIGGTLRIDSVPGQGTNVSMEIRRTG